MGEGLIIIDEGKVVGLVTQVVEVEVAIGEEKEVTVDIGVIEIVVDIDRGLHQGRIEIKGHTRNRTY
jgi:hypothetical protein